MPDARSAAHREPRRLNVVALGLTLACLVALGWAVRGLMADPLPTVDDFGATATSAPSPLTDPSASSVDGAAAAQTRAPSAASLAPPGRSSAALPPVRERAVPVKVTIPSLDLEVAIDPVAIAPDGQMEIPEEPDRAGWYRYGPAPGSPVGSVVLAGHVDTTTGPGAFLELTRIVEGAEVVVQMADGSVTTYQVVGGENVAKSDLPVDEIFRRDGDPVLRLVTCSGDWSPRTGHYTDNLVVTAVPVP